MNTYAELSVSVCEKYSAGTAGFDQFCKTFKLTAAHKVSSSFCSVKILQYQGHANTNPLALQENLSMKW